MNTATPSKLIAIVGGSGAGKSWLVHRLCAEFGDDATPVSLDDFYHDLSHLTPPERERTNFDHPEAIDWPRFAEVICDLRHGLPVTLPRYDFTTHTRVLFGETIQPRSLIFAEGLWLLWPPHIRELFELRIFLDCPESVRWQRRLARDLETRGRTRDSIQEQFWNAVAPMHERFVATQKPWANFLLEQPMSEVDFARLVGTIHALRTMRAGDHWKLHAKKIYEHTNLASEVGTGQPCRGRADSVGT